MGKEIERGINYHKMIIPVQIGEVILSDAFELYISTDQAVVLERLQKEDFNNLNCILDTIMECTNLNKDSKSKDKIMSKILIVLEENFELSSFDEFKALVEHRKIIEAINI